MDERFKTAATFGGAMAVMGLAPDLEADVVPLNFSQGSVSFQSFPTVTVPVTITAAASFVASFAQWNNSIGKTMFAWNGATVGTAGPGSFSVTSNQTFLGANAIYFSVSDAATRCVVFTDTIGNHGWFALDLGGPFGAITYLAGAYGTAGETLHVPAPAGLVLLALGAVSIRRKRSRAG